VKKIAIMMSLLVAFLAMGCSQVVYRVMPDSPPQMGTQEAREALERSLSLAQMPEGVQSVKLQGDELVTAGASNLSGGGNIRASYNNISRLVEKQGNEFAVSVYFTGMAGNRLMKLYWKSEADAKSFVDAGFLLRQAKLPDKK
jgi:hypothetical protein